MARRPRRYLASAIEALSMRKPCASYGLLQSFDRQKRCCVQLGSANGLSQHGEAMPQNEARQRAIHLRIFPFRPQYELQRQLHAEIDHRFVRRASDGNLHRQMNSVLLPAVSPTSPLACHMHAWMLIHFGATGGAFRSFCTILHHDPVQKPNADNKIELERKKPVAVVVLLGWLGAKHRHLRRYADWYTSNGMHVVTFVIPIADVIRWWKAEKHVEILSQQLLELQMNNSNYQDQEKFLIFHTFSNTGWMIYGALLEVFLQSSKGVQLVKKIKGCVLDSGPAPNNEPRAWAAGLCAAILKKSSVATQAQLEHEDKAPSRMEVILIGFFEKLVAGFLQIPYIKRRVDDVTFVLLKKQPLCPQLYLYSDADTVIPATSIEFFIAEQKKSGFRVQTCNFHSSPHVDHFRSFPVKYKEQLASFLESCQLQHKKANVCVAKS